MFLVDRAPLLAWTFRLGLTWGLLLLAVIALTRPLAGQQQGMENNVVPVPGATPQAAHLRGRVPCDEIISALNHEISLRSRKGIISKRGSTASLETKRAIMIEQTALRIGTTKLWMVECMHAYGRRVPASLEQRWLENGGEDVAAELENAEPEEALPEDVPEPGVANRDPRNDENPKDKQVLRAEDPNNTRENQAIPDWANHIQQ